MLSLDKQKIVESIPQHILKEIKRLEIFDSIGSTNTEVLNKFVCGEGAGYLCIAEQQTEGRGRYGKNWYSPYQQNLYLSYGFTTKHSVGKICGLSLVVGYKVAERLQKLGLKEVGLKWPNDILINYRKISGVLIEVVQQPELNEVAVVVGIGLNVNMLEGNQAIDAPSTSVLSSIYEQGWAHELDKLSVSYNQQKIISRTHLVSIIIVDIIEGVMQFLEGGFAQFRDKWNHFDCLEDSQVVFRDGEKEVSGLAKGVGLSGEYMVELDGQICTLMSGEVSLRRK